MEQRYCEKHSHIALILDFGPYGICEACDEDYQRNHCEKHGWPLDSNYRCPACDAEIEDMGGII